MNKMRPLLQSGNGGAAMAKAVGTVAHLLAQGDLATPPSHAPGALLAAHYMLRHCARFQLPLLPFEGGSRFMLALYSTIGGVVALCVWRCNVAKGRLRADVAKLNAEFRYNSTFRRAVVCASNTNPTRATLQDPAWACKLGRPDDSA